MTHLARLRELAEKLEARDIKNPADGTTSDFIDLMHLADPTTLLALLDTIKELREALGKSECQYSEVSVNARLLEKKHSSNCHRCEALARFRERWEGKNDSGPRKKILEICPS